MLSGMLTAPVITSINLRASLQPSCVKRNVCMARRLCSVSKTMALDRPMGGLGEPFAEGQHFHLSICELSISPQVLAVSFKSQLSASQGLGSLCRENPWQQEQIAPSRSVDMQSLASACEIRPSAANALACQHGRTEGVWPSAAGHELNAWLRYMQSTGPALSYKKLPCRQQTTTQCFARPALS